MPMVKVWNDNVHPYNETFKDQKIHIPPKSFIEMEAGEANDFRGTRNFITEEMCDSDGRPTAKAYKMIRIEPIKKDAEATTQVNPRNICQACKYEAASEKDLMEHAKASHETFTDAVAEEEMTKRRGRPAKAS